MRAGCGRGPTLLAAYYALVQKTGAASGAAADQMQQTALHMMCRAQACSCGAQHASQPEQREQREHRKLSYIRSRYILYLRRYNEAR